MTVAPFNFSSPIVGPDGYPTTAFMRWLEALRMQDNTAATMAAAAVPNTRRVVASGGLQVGGDLMNDVAINFYKVATTVTQLPTTTTKDGDWAYAKNGRKPGEAAGAGTGVPCYRSIDSWIAVTSGVAVTA